MSKPKTYKILIFNERTKWKYNDRLVLPRELSYKDLHPYLRAIEEGMQVTPKELRQTSFSRVPNGWRVIVPKNPYGYPIMAVGDFREELPT